MLFFLFALFLLTRLLLLTHLPIFNDEAIYLHWGLDFMQNFGAGVTPVTIGGKQLGVPLLFGLVQLLPFDPLLSGRLLSVAFSSLTYCATIATFGKLFPGRSFILLSLLLIFSPYLLFFDRLALIDSIIVAVYSTAFLLVLFILEKPTFRRSFLFGTLLAFGWWMKSTILLAFPTIFLIFSIESFWNRRKIQAFILSYAMILLAFSFGILPVLLHPNYWKLPLQETERLLTFSEILTMPFSIWWANAQQIVSYLFVYATPMVFIFFLRGIFSLIRVSPTLFLKPGDASEGLPAHAETVTLPNREMGSASGRTRIKMERNSPLLFWFLIPTLIEFLFFRRIDSRYILLVVPSLLLIAATTLDSGPLRRSFSEARDQRIKLYQFLTIGIAMLLSFFLIFSPPRFYSLFRVFSFIQDDFHQYVAGWTSGYGVKEAVEYVKEKSAGKPTFVFVRNDSGNPEDALYVYLQHEKHIRVTSLVYLDFFQSQKEALTSSDVSFYFISRGPQYAGLENQLTELTRFKKPLDDEFVGVYRLKRFNNSSKI